MKWRGAGRGAIPLLQGSIAQSDSIAGNFGFAQRIRVGVVGCCLWVSRPWARPAASFGHVFQAGCAFCAPPPSEQFGGRELFVMHAWPREAQSFATACQPLDGAELFHCVRDADHSRLGDGFVLEETALLPLRERISK